MSDTTHEVDLAGAMLEVNGDLYAVEEGTLTYREEYLKDASGEPMRKLSDQIEIEVTTHEPECEWPKPWDDITEDDDFDGDLFSGIKTSWVSMGPIRCYEGTVYINADAGREGDNGDEWLPLGRYLAGHTTKE